LGSEPHCPYASIASSGLPRQSLAFLPRNYKMHVVTEPHTPITTSCLGEDVVRGDPL
jgi:hypothetical protein